MPRTATPIVFVHGGDAPYLAFTLRQARWASPENPIYLLGDAANRHFLDEGIVDGHYDLADFTGVFQEFDAAYVHLSAGSEAFERFCFHRWFALRALARQQGWQRLWCLDSDVLLYDSLGHEEAQLGAAQMAVCFAGVPAYTYFTLEELDRFCAYILETYRTRLGYLRDCFTFYLKQNPGITWGGITDMHVFWMYVQEPTVQALDLSLTRAGAVFDQDFHQPQGFEMNPALAEKRIVWKGKVPYFVTAGTGERVRVKGLHCASGGKPRIYAYYTAPGLLLERTRHALKRGLSALRAWVGSLRGS